MNRERYEAIVCGFAGRRITVLGDLMMDEYLWGQATRISPESPVMVVEVERESRVPGGAANVVNNLVALGAQVSVIGVVGDDEAGSALREALQSEGAEVSGIVTDPSRPTTRKTRVVAHSQQVLRVDREQARPLAPEAESKICGALKALDRESSAILVSDYSKGVVTSRIAESAREAAEAAGALLTANPKPANAYLLRGADLLTLNQVEAEEIAGSGSFSREEILESAGKSLRNRLNVRTLIVTRGSRGLSLWRDNGEHLTVPAHPVEVYDVAGAGDTVVSALTLALAGGAPPQDAAAVANHAAACVVRKLGVATVSPDELIADWWDNGSV